MLEDREPSLRKVTGQDGQGMVEYGLVLLLVSIASFGLLGTFGVTLAAAIEQVANTFP